MFQAVKVFPSVHTVVAATEPIGIETRDLKVNFEFGIEALRYVLSPTLKHNTVLAIVGERNTYKTHLSRHFLIHGLCPSKVEVGLPGVHGNARSNEKLTKEQESVLLVRLHEQVSFNPKQAWMLAEDIFENEATQTIDWKGFKECGRWLESSKLIKRSYMYAPNGATSGPWLFELALKGGAILPEEFLQFVRNILRNQPAGYPIRRVVLDDVAFIGASYPLLRQSENAGDLFLSAFVHVMRNFDVNLVLLGTKTGLKEADEMVNRACTLADEVLTCDYCNVFGDRYITIRGGGLAAGEAEHNPQYSGEEHYEMAPAVIIPGRNNRFSVDLNKLKGLAGFGTNRIHRPGLMLHAFQDNETIHSEYNKELKNLISTALGITSMEGRRNIRESRKIQSNVQVITFGSRQSDSFHDGLELMAGKPIDKTIASTVDEFFVISGEESEQRAKVFAQIPDDVKNRTMANVLEHIRKRMKESPIGVLPYHANVLIVAYRKDLMPQLDAWCNGNNPSRIISWSKLDKNLFAGRSFDWDSTAIETHACLLLDVLGPRDAHQWAAFCKNPMDQLKNHLLNNGNYIKKQLTALYRLVSKTNEDKMIPSEAAVYVCWYSQLRKLIEQHHDLADKLRVCALPNGGFSGDWYIGVVHGSVNISLGHHLIEILCRKKEEYKRLYHGVGLPTTNDFYEENNKFMAWPGSEVCLSELRNILGNARSRAEIKNYQSIKTILYAAWDELVAGKPVEEILERLPDRIQAMLP